MFGKKRVRVIHAPIRKRYVVTVKDGFFADWDAVGWYDYTSEKDRLEAGCDTKDVAFEKAVAYAEEINAREVVWEG